MATLIDYTIRERKLVNHLEDLGVDISRGLSIHGHKLVVKAWNEEVFNAIAQKTNNNKLHQGEMGIEFYVNDNERDWLVFLDINKREEFLQK